MAAKAPRNTSGALIGLELRIDLPCAMTLAAELREQWTEARRVLQRQLAALERGHLGGAFGPEKLTVVRNAIQGGIAIYDGLLRLPTLE